MAGKRMPKRTTNQASHDSGEIINLLEHRAMIYLPENSVGVLINASVYEDGEIIEVSKKMTMEEIRDAFRKADDGYIDDDDRFVITEEGKAYLEELKKGL